MSWPVYSEENFKKMVEHAPIGILIIDKEMKWRFVNQRFCDITGFSRKELAGKTFLDITYKEDIDLNLQLYHQLLRGEVNEYTYEKRYVRKNGQIIWVRLAVAAVRLNGEYSHMVVSVEDIEDTKRNQHMLEVKNDELDTLLYKASHDLKAPVTTLVGLCHLLRLEQQGLQENELFKHLEETVLRLRNQNESLLELTRIQDMEPVAQNVFLERLVETVLGELPIDRQAVRLTDLQISMVTDDRLLGIALRRIIENACIYLKPGTKPHIIVDHVHVPGRHKITVSDLGTGIAKKELEHIMTMFYRASIHSRGSGMGLYIAKKAIEKLQGEIVVTSIDGEGSTFSILLPFN